ncbi:superoxide dismutase family protein [Ottowia sp.]|uniref:superoxide dismutase family protein n=1 Tax=Ottowia sp. TaxID=1898956 RepID=UPI003A873D77
MPRTTDYALNTTARLALLAAAGAVAALALTGCSALSWGKTASVQLQATSVPQPNAAQPVAGQLKFSPVAGGVRVTGTVSGLKPNAPQAFHVHEKGDCSAADASSAGGHFNPTGQPHGAFTAHAHHVGDMPSLQANASGVAKVDFISQEFALEGASSIVGKSVIVHRDPDDVNSQPSGNAGPRLACGVIVKG